jgi:hypothetical protein
MKRTITYLAIVMLAVSAAVTVAGATTDKNDKDKEVTIKGEVIDLPCYEGKNGARGEAHKACATSCAKRGNQMAIIDADNNIYAITGDYAANKNEKLIEFVAATVEAKGKVTEKDGKKIFEVSSMKEAKKK